MEVTVPTFVLINNAQREIFYGDPLIPEARIETRPYAQGEVGLIHPEVIKSFSQLSEPCKTASGKSSLMQEVFRGFVRGPYRSTDEILPTYVPTSGEIPVVLYDERQNTDYSSQGLFGETEIRRRNPGYFIVPLMPAEFQVLAGSKFGTLCEEIGCLPHSSDDRRELLRENVRWLKVLTSLMSGAYHQLPIEVTQRKREQREVDEFLARYQR